MKITGLIVLFFGLISCADHTFKNNSNLEKNIDNLAEIQEDSFHGVIINSALSNKFDSIRALYEEYDKRQELFDTLMLFKKNNQDTFISKSEVKFLESFDPNAAYYLFNSDTIIGGNGYCSSDFYLLQKGKLVKVISQFADCVESSSLTRQEIYFDSDDIRLFYFKDIEDVWDEYKLKQGFESIATEIYAVFVSSDLQFGIQKRIIKCRSDIKTSDTLIYKLLDYNDLSLPEIKFKKED